MSLIYKGFGVTVCGLVLTACASTSNQLGNYQLNQGVTDIDSIPKTYTLQDFDLTLNQKVENSAYPDQKALEEMFIKKLNQELVVQNKLSQGDGMALDIDMAYKRIFEGEMLGFSKIYATNRCEYTATLSYEGKQIASFNDEPMTNTSIKDEQKSLLGNLKKMAEVYSFSGNQETEEKDINTCVQRIVERLPE